MADTADARASGKAFWDPTIRAGSRTAMIHAGVELFFGPDVTVELLRKAYDALVPGGTVVINQYIADDGRRRRREALVQALWLYASTVQGDAYTTSECRGFLERAGFVDPVERELTGVEDVLVRATKP